MELVNASYDLLGSGKEDSQALKEAATNIVLLLSPFVPHIAEEMWAMLGNKDSILKAKWPSYDKSVIIEQVVTIPIQVNGKLRSRVEVPADIEQDELKALVLSDEKVRQHLAGKAVKDVIIIPKRLANVVSV
jgi:leucyl-tRNA synthetase